MKNESWCIEYGKLHQTTLGGRGIRNDNTWKCGKRMIEKYNIIEKSYCI